jgi:type VI secretion system protein ImpH
LNALLDAVAAEPWSYDFFGLLRRIEALTPWLPRIGTAPRPSREPIRLGQAAELDFAPAPLAKLERRGGLPHLSVRFFGLLGPQGPMPLHFTEYVRERQRKPGASDPTLVHFLDVFHHRLLALFYRAWAHTQPTVHRDRPHTDRYAAWLGSAIGLDEASKDRDSIPDVAKLHQAGLLAGRSRHAEGLSKLLAGFFGVPVSIEPYVAHWLRLHPDDRSRLGVARNRRRLGAAAALGRGATAGSKVWDRQSKFRICLGPLTLEQYLGFLPGAPAWRQLVDWVHAYIGMDRRWDVQLELAKAEVPPPRLGRQLRLGLTSWSGRAATVDRADLRLRPGTSFLLRSTGAAHG